MTDNSKKNIVISAINITGEGPLGILKECLKYLSENLSQTYNLIALVHDKSLLKIDKVKYYEFPAPKKIYLRWLNKLYYEQIYFKKFSRRIRPLLWLSLLDMTPNVESEILAVYCNNPAPFYKIPLKSFFLEPSLLLFNWLYKYVYQINIKKNDYVIVQQSWLREEFIRLFRINNIIVSHPEINSKGLSLTSDMKNGKYKFFYPVFPRPLKNFEIICEATKILVNKRVYNFEVYLTLNGKENRYSKYIYNRYKGIEQIRFIGLQAREKIYNFHSEADCLIFPSKLETWGLPITEFKNYNKPILLADLRYAHETIGNYDQVRFFDPDNPVKLSDLMAALIKNRLTFDRTKAKVIEPPFASNWKELFNIIVGNKGG